MRYKDETKVQLILDTAFKMIARIGLSGLKMSDLAKEAGVATGTVYIYFEDKDQLIHELYSRLMRQSTLDLSQNVSDNDPLKIRINKMTRSYLDDNIKNPEYGAFLEQYFRSPYAQKEDGTHLEEEKPLQPIYRLMLEGQRQTLIKDADPEWLVMLIGGMLDEVAKRIIYTKKPITDAEWELTFGVLWDGIKG